MVESNLSYFGGALCFFILLGIGLQLATDATSPESLPPSIRGSVAAIVCIFPFLALTLASVNEIKKATFMSALQGQDPDLVVSLAQDLRTSPYSDPEARYLSTFDPNLEPESRLETLQTVAAQMPTPKFLRAAARQAQSLDKNAEAIAYLDKVFRIDPANLPAGKLKLDFYQELGQTQDAIQAAKDLIAMEETVSFQVRAIPENVPTETLDARIFLAENTADPEESIRLRQEAVDGYLEYHRVTLAKLLWMKSEMQTADPSQTVEDRQVTYGSESLADARVKLERAQENARILASTYQKQGQDSKAADALSASETLAVQG